MGTLSAPRKSRGTSAAGRPAWRSGALRLDCAQGNESAGAMSKAEEMKSDEVLRVELEVFRREHRDLDDAIAALEASGRADQLRLRRLKKQKLALKDKIARIEDQLTPDIIA